MRIWARPPSRRRLRRSGWRNDKVKLEVNVGLKVLKKLLLSALLLSKVTFRFPPVGRFWLTPKFQTVVLLVTVSPPEKKLVWGLSCDVLRRVDEARGS